MSTQTKTAAAAHRAAAVTPTLSTGSSYRLGTGLSTLLAVPLGFLTIAMLVPLGFVVWQALFGEGKTTFASVLGDGLFQAALVRTVLMAAIVTVISLVLGLVYALAICLAPRPLKILLVAGIGATFVVSLMVRTYGWIILLQPKGLLFNLLSSLHLIDGPLQILQTPPAMYLGMVHVMLPYAILLTHTSLTSMDPNQLKAAQSMGASARLTFWRVVMPQIRAGVVAGGLLVFLISLGFYITPALLGGPSQLTMGTLIGLQMSGTFDFKAAAIMGTLLFVSVTILYILAERIFKITRQWDRI